MTTFPRRTMSNTAHSAQTRTNTEQCHRHLVMCTTPLLWRTIAHRMVCICFSMAPLGPLSAFRTGPLAYNGNSSIVFRVEWPVSSNEHRNESPTEWLNVISY